MIDHAFVKHPWGQDCCDAKIDDAGMARSCAAPAREHDHGFVPSATYVDDHTEAGGRPLSERCTLCGAARVSHRHPAGESAAAGRQSTSEMVRKELSAVVKGEIESLKARIAALEQERDELRRENALYDPAAIAAYADHRCRAAETRGDAQSEEAR